MVCCVIWDNSSNLMRAISDTHNAVNCTRFLMQLLSALNKQMWCAPTNKIKLHPSMECPCMCLGYTLFRLVIFENDCVSAYFVY